MKTLLFLALLTLTSCAKSHYPFAPDHKYGNKPTKKNVEVKNNAWIYKQWGGEGR